MFHSIVGLLLALVETSRLLHNSQHSPVDATGPPTVACRLSPPPPAPQALPVLMERLGDSNPRLRDGARDALLSLAQNRESGLRCSGGNAALLKPVKSQTAWRPVLSTLQLMQVRAARHGAAPALKPLDDFAGQAVFAPPCTFSDGFFGTKHMANASKHPGPDAGSCSCTRTSHPQPPCRHPPTVCIHP